jgi:ketosteroid isomerase-like protein
VAAAVLVAAVGAPVAAQAPARPAAAMALPASAREAAATVDAFHAALGRGDTKAALAYVADDALIFEEGRAERSKAEYASHHLAADAAFSKAVPAVRLRRTGHSAGNLAWVGTESRVKGSFRGRDVDRVMVETMVLRRAGGKWLIAHIHWSSAEAGD